MSSKGILASTDFGEAINVTETVAYVRRRRMWEVIAVLLLLALAEFCVRGPIRAVHHRDFNDFISPYIQSNAWLSGLDPYDPRVLAQLWPLEAGIPQFVVRESYDGTLPARRGVPSPYPLTAFPLLVPFALLPWSAAFYLWTTLNVASFATVVICVLRLGRTPVLGAEAAFITFCALALAPFQTAIATSNVTVVVFALGMLAVVSLENTGRRDACAGLLLTAAAALKPTVALCFFIYFVSKGRWRALVIAALGGAAVLAVADVRMLTAGVHWVSSYLTNTRRMFGSGAIDDYTSANSLRFDLLNLQVILSQVLRKRLLIESVSWLIVLGFLGCWSRFYRKPAAFHDRLFNLSVLAVITLLPFYHRFTDAGMLFPALAWSISESIRRRGALAKAILILASPFLLPGAALLKAFAASNSTASRMALSWWWQFFVEPHQVWLLVAILVLLLISGTRRSQSIVPQ
jgi:hypothetical protein